MDEAHRCLYTVMEAHQKSQDAYGRFLSIVQSSVVGKSRMVDGLSKQYLVISGPRTNRVSQPGHLLSNLEPITSCYRISSGRFGCP